jgi:CHASE2 domain-containing sensor protein
LFKLNYLEIKSNNKIIATIPLSIDNKEDKFVVTPLFLNKKIPNAYSIYDIIHDEDNIYKDKLEDKTVFIGATDESLNDIKLSYI